MSHIDDMVIFTELDEGEAMARVNAWCAANGRGQQFERLDIDAAGGLKVFTSEVWAMAGNYFPLEKLAEALPTFGWADPSRVVLVAAGDTVDVDAGLVITRAAPS